MPNLGLLGTNLKLCLKYSLRADHCYSTYDKVIRLGFELGNKAQNKS